MTEARIQSRRVAPRAGLEPPRPPPACVWLHSGEGTAAPVTQRPGGALRRHLTRLERGRLALALGLVTLLLGCTASGVREQALADLADPERRDAALVQLAELALIQDGDHAKAATWLGSRSPVARKGRVFAVPADGRGAVVAALTADGVGDLDTQIAAWLQAIRPEQELAVRVLAAHALLALEDYVSGAVGARFDVRLPGRWALLGEQVSHALRRRAPHEWSLRTAFQIDSYPLTRFAAGPDDGYSAWHFGGDGAALPVVDAEWAVGNPAPGLAVARFEASGRWLEVHTRHPFVLRSGEQVLLRRDTTAGYPPERLTVWVPPDAGALELLVAATEPHARVGLWRSRTMSARDRAAHDGTRHEGALGSGWIAAFARGQAAARAGDEMAWHAALEELSTVAPAFAAGRLLQAELPRGGVNIDRLLGEIGGLGHASAIRRLARGALDDGRETDALRHTPALLAVNDARSALLAWEVLRSAGLGSRARGALERAIRLAPDACAPALADLQRRWTRLKLRGQRPDLPAGCAHRPAIRLALASFDAETGRLAAAQKTLQDDADRRGTPSRHAGLRARLFERAGEKERALALSRRAVGGSVQGLARLANQAAALGAPISGLADELDRLAGGDLEMRLGLMALSDERLWERFAPDVEARLAAPIDPALTAGEAAVLVLDHTASVHFRDGTRILHYHQVLKLLSESALAELGEAHLPPGARVLRAVTRKADGRVLEPEDITQKDSISFPELEVGDAIELEYLTGLGRDESLGGHWIGEPVFLGVFDIPTAWSQTVVLAQSGTPIVYDTHGDVPEPEIVTAAGYSGWRWLGGARPAVRIEPGAVNPYDLLSQIQVSSGIEWTDIAALARESLLGLVAPDRRVRELSRQLAGLDGSELSAARAMYGWVRDEITEDENSFLDASAARTALSGEGERVILLLALLREYGSRASLAMIDPVNRSHAARRIPNLRDYSYLAVHLVDADGEEHWLDPHYVGAPFGFLAPTARGRSAWLVDLDGPMRRVTTPSTSAVRERRTVQIDLRVAADGTVSGQWTEEAMGMDAVVYREGLRAKSPRERAVAISEIVRDTLPGARLGEIRIAGLHDTDMPVRVDVPIHGVGPRRALDLALTPVYASIRWVQGATRRAPLYVGRMEDIVTTVNITFAPGAVMPAGAVAPVRWRAPFARYERVVEQTGRSLSIRRSLRLRPQVVEPHQYEMFRRFCSTIDAGDKVTIPLR